MRAARSAPYVFAHRSRSHRGCDVRDARSFGSGTLPREARRSNDAMTRYAVDLLAAELGSLQRRRILILGFAYRENVREDFASSAKKLISAITTEGGCAFVHDPYYSDEELRGHGARPYDLLHPEPV